MSPLSHPRPNRSTLQSLERDIHDTLRQFFGAEEGPFDPSTRTWSPQMDVRETDEEYRIHVDVPGVSADEITINADDHRLTIHGERTASSTEENESVIRRERARGAFSRSVVLPDTATVDDATAEFEDGILTIHVPKAENEPSRSIPIS